jgi:hypothetical protein
MIEQAGSSMEQVLALSELEHNPRMGISERVKQESDAVIMLQSAIELTKNPALPLHLGRRFDVTCSRQLRFRDHELHRLRQLYAYHETVSDNSGCGPFMAGT